jgi:hypothetical protein
MPKRHIAQVVPDDDEFETDELGREICPDCGEPLEPLTPDELFAMRMDAICEILDEMTPWHQGTAIAFLGADHLANLVKPRSRDAVRSEIIRIMDEKLQHVLQDAKASRKGRKVIDRLAESMALMPDVPSTIN